MKDVYIEEISRAFVENGIVCLVGSVNTDAGGKDVPKEETVRIRIPIAKYQKLTSSVREVLLKAMTDGWFGEAGKKAAETLGKED